MFGTISQITLKHRQEFVLILAIMEYSSTTRASVVDMIIRRRVIFTDRISRWHIGIVLQSLTYLPCLGLCLGLDPSVRPFCSSVGQVGSFSEKQIAALYKAATTNDQVYNAHKYSPDLVGGKLWEIIKPHWDRFNQKTKDEWMITFPDDSEPEDFPF